MQLSVGLVFISPRNLLPGVVRFLESASLLPRV